MAFAFAANPGNSAHAEIRDSITRKFGFPSIVPRFSALPVEKSSMTTTAFPSAKSRSTRCEPMKPAPPVTRINEEFKALKRYWLVTLYFQQLHWKRLDYGPQACPSAHPRQLPPVSADTPGRRCAA